LLRKISPNLNKFDQIIEKHWVIWVFSILIFSFLIRLWGLYAESAWIDEAYSIVLSKYTVSEIIKGTAADQHPPLYYLILHFWMKVGDGVNHARLLSVIIGLFGVTQTLVFFKSLGGYTIGLLSGILIALSPMHIWFSQEARMYIFLSYFTIGATHMLWKGINDNRFRWWFLYSLFCLLALYTQYFSIFIIVAHGSWIITEYFCKKTSSLIINWLGSSAIVGLLFSPWLPIVIDQSKNHVLTWITTPSLAQIRDVFLRIVIGVSVLGVPEYGRSIILLFLIVFFSITFFHFSNSTRKDYSFLAFMSILPFLIITFVSFFYPIFQYKQFIIILIPIIAFISFNIIYGKKFWNLSLLFFVLFFSMTSVIYQAISITKDNWEDATYYLQDHIEENDVIFGNPFAISLTFSLYNKSLLSYFEGYPQKYDIISGGWDGEIINKEIANQLLQATTKNKDRLWLVEFTPEFWDPNHEIEAWLKEKSRLIIEKNFNNIQIKLYDF
jgi:uncharacterized membrane protein